MDYQNLATQAADVAKEKAAQAATAAEVAADAETEAIKEKATANAATLKENVTEKAAELKEKTGACAGLQCPGNHRREGSRIQREAEKITHNSRYR